MGSIERENNPAAAIAATPATMTSVTSGPQCAICMNALHDGVTLDPCEHAICQGCFGTWAQTCRCAIPGVPPECVHCATKRVECPFCRVLTTHPSNPENDKIRRKHERDQRHALRRARERRQQEREANVRWVQKQVTLTKDSSDSIGVRFRGKAVIEVVRNSPAEAAGLRQGVRIIEVERRTVEDHSDAVHDALRAAPSTFTMRIEVPQPIAVPQNDVPIRVTGGQQTGSAAAAAAASASAPPASAPAPAAAAPPAAPVAVPRNATRDAQREEQRVLQREIEHRRQREVAREREREKEKEREAERNLRLERFFADQREVARGDRPRVPENVRHAVPAQRLGDVAQQRRDQERRDLRDPYLNLMNDRNKARGYLERMQQQQPARDIPRVPPRMPQNLPHRVHRSPVRDVRGGPGRHYDARLAMP